MMLLCFALVEQLSKKDKRKLCDSHGRQIARDVDDEMIFGDSVSKLLDTLAETAATIKSATEKQSASIRELVSCFDNEKVMAERRMKLPALLRQIDGLTDEQRVKACIIIGRADNLTDLIFSLEPEERLILVSQVLEESS